MNKQKKRLVGNPLETGDIDDNNVHIPILDIEDEHAGNYPFRNPQLSVEERIDNLLSIMTPEEKTQLFFPSGRYFPRLGFGLTGHVEGYHGAALGGPAGWGGWPDTPTTQFCQAIGLAATWDPELVKQAAEVEAVEFRYIFHRFNKGGLIVRAPNADMGRDIRWGRNEECFGEDPYLSGELAAAFVQGLQGDDPVYLRTAALLKHFLANSNEDNRSVSSSDFDDRLFREYYSAAFCKGFLKGGANCFMAAYNAFNGVPCTVHPVIKNIVIKENWVDGIICTDGGGLVLLVTDHNYFPGLKEAVAGCVKAGINQFLEKDKKVFIGIHDALEQKLITINDLDKVLRGNLRIMFRLGLLDPPEMVPYTKVGNRDPWLSEKHQILARHITGKSIVLLKNAGNVLPINRRKVKRIAVAGRLANAVHLDWYSGTPPYCITILEGIKNNAGSLVEVVYADKQEQAVTLSRSSDVAVVCIGNHPTCHNIGWGKSPFPSEGKEAVDRQAITLEPHDLELVKQVYKANPNTIVVLVASFPYSISWIDEYIPAILHMTHNSQEQGNALADVLFGDVNPAGRTVQTWPRSLHQLPDILNYNIRNNRTYMYFKDPPLYPFGYGLSYTTFSYSNLLVSDVKLDPDKIIIISVDVTNTGSRAGDEVVQMYVRHLHSVVPRPIKELKGFKRVYIKAGETETITFTVRDSDLAYWDAKIGEWVVEPGSVVVMAGGSSSDNDLKLSQTIEVTGNQ